MRRDNVIANGVVHAQLGNNDWSHPINHTACGILIKGYWEGRFPEATNVEFIDRPVDCMACLARGSS